MLEFQSKLSRQQIWQRNMEKWQVEDSVKVITQCGSFSRAVKLKKKYLSTCSLFFKLMWYQCFRLQTRNFLKGTHRSHFWGFCRWFNHCFKSLFNQIFVKCVVYSLKIRIETLLYFKRRVSCYDLILILIWLILISPWYWWMRWVKWIVIWRAYYLGTSCEY